MKISITLPSLYPEALLRCLESIRSSSHGEIEIIVVTPNIQPIPFELGAGQSLRWITEEDRRGCTAAHNKGMAAATGEFVTPFADDCEYHPGWDIEAAATYERRYSKDRPFVLGLHHGLVGTAFGIYFPAFSFMPRALALELGYFDPDFKKDFTDPDLGLRVWWKGGRCEFSEKRLVTITSLDNRKGGENCLDCDLQRFRRIWGQTYGRSFRFSHMRALIADFDPVKNPQYVSGNSVFSNSPGAVRSISLHSPPHLLGSHGVLNIVWFRAQAIVVPQEAGEIEWEISEKKLRALGCKFFKNPSAAYRYAASVDRVGLVKSIRNRLAHPSKAQAN